MLLSSCGGVSVRYCTAVFADGTVYAKPCERVVNALLWRSSYQSCLRGFRTAGKAVVGDTTLREMEGKCVFKTYRASFIKVQLAEIFDKATY